MIKKVTINQYLVLKAIYKSLEIITADDNSAVVVIR